MSEVGQSPRTDEAAVALPASVGCTRLSGSWSVQSSPSSWSVRRHRSVLNGVSVPAPFDLDSFLRALERARGRRIAVTTVRTKFPFARSMWWAGADSDHVLVGSNRPRLYRDHLALHGIGHLLYRHTGTSNVTDLARTALTDLDVARVLHHLRRLLYTAEEEHEAEMFASHVLRLAMGCGITGGHRSAGPPNVAAALSAVLEYQPHSGAGR